MAWKPDSEATFSGGSGQMAVIAELLARKCNAAVPFIDVGTDVFAFRENHPVIARIQVKTEAGNRYKRGDGWSAKFGVPLARLSTDDEPPLFYALVVRLDGQWVSFLVISRSILKTMWNNGLGSDNQQSGNLELHIQYRLEPTGSPTESGRELRLTARCGSLREGVFDLTQYLDAWDSLPPLQPPALKTPAGSGPPPSVQIQAEDLN